MKTSLISIIGRPNAGKSTLLNQVVGQKLSIVTPKVQTTRSAIKGILTDEDSQLIFIDTPGIFNPSKKLEKAMVRCAWSSIVGTDTVCVIIDLSNPRNFDDEFKKILKYIASLTANKIILLNKIDKLTIDVEECDNSTNNVEKILKNRISEEFLKEILDLKELFKESRFFFISALENKNINDLLLYLKEISPESPFLYDKDEITTAPMKFLCNEITREQLFLNLSEELPYNLTVETEKWEQISKNEVKIYQSIIVNKDTHKMIVLGKNGTKIKKISTNSRLEIRKSFGLKVHLFLFIKVRTKWDDDPSYYKSIGLEMP